MTKNEGEIGGEGVEISFRRQAKCGEKRLGAFPVGALVHKGKQRLKIHGGKGLRVALVLLGQLCQLQGAFLCGGSGGAADLHQLSNFGEPLFVAEQDRGNQNGAVCLGSVLQELKCKR